MQGVGVKSLSGQFLRMLNAMLLDPSNEVGPKDVKQFEIDTSSAQQPSFRDGPWIADGEADTLFEESDR